MIYISVVTETLCRYPEYPSLPATPTPCTLKGLPPRRALFLPHFTRNTHTPVTHTHISTCARARARTAGTAHEVTWAAGKDGKTQFITTSRSFADGATVTFTTTWPTGAKQTSLVEHNASGDKSNQEVIANFPAFTTNTLPNTLSWEGSFVGAQHNRGLDVTGPTGGPTVFFDASDPKLATVVVMSPLDNFKAWSAGPGTTWDGTTPAFAPGTAGTITSIPAGFTHTMLLRVGTKGGITATIGEWGMTLQAVHKTTRMVDLTLTNIGYQTDNGAGVGILRRRCCVAALTREH